MKAHDLAKSLNTLARMLRAGPNVELEEIGNLSTHTSKGVDRSPKKNAEGRSGAIALLAAMSNLKKAEVLQMADDLAIPIEVRKADAVRDILGKMLRYIQDNPEVQDRLVMRSVHNSEEEAPKLARALAILMDR
mgnify:CR=1 FL=1|jgi:hypothetical protein|tara:strand:- start:2034 stop:2435 length:402 start_codon:yes stop_codon:yes gene_type:complete